jgi:hypothetical protein
VRSLRTLAAIVLGVGGPVATAGAADVDVALEQFGVGSAWRAGEMPGAIRVRLTSTVMTQAARRVWAQWEVPDADGDISAWGREVTLTAGRPTSLWLYAPLPGPHRMLNSTVTLVRVFDYDDASRGAELGVLRVTAAAANAMDVRPDQGMILQIGRRSLALEDYRNLQEPDLPVAANEDTRIVSGVRPDELPDRWYPLKSFEAVVWGPDASPQDLRLDAAQALRDFIERGGHLIIVLPEANPQWGLGADQGAIPAELGSLLPRQAPRKDDAVPISALLPALAKPNTVPRTPAGQIISFNVSIRVFKEIGGQFNAIDRPYEPLIALADGRVVVIQRTFGHGRITIVGIDVSNGQLRAVELPQADAFWNRILGRRHDTPRKAELDAMAKAQRIVSRFNQDRINLGSGRLMEEHINMSSRAGRGLGVAMLLFGSYFAAAAFGFVFLRQYRQEKHAWLVFVATAVIFTGFAWGAASLMRERTPKIQHLTYLDHVAQRPDALRSDERQLQRAVSWFNLNIPDYGQPRVSIDSLEGERDLLMAWSSPHRAPDYFPNADTYAVDMGHKPADYRVPGRATAKQFYSHYLGPVDDSWGGLITVLPGDPVRVGRTSRGDMAILGTIKHGLPGNLTDIRVIWVKDFRVPPPMYERGAVGLPEPWVLSTQSGRMLNVGEFIAVSAQRAWEPGVSYDLREELMVRSGSKWLETNIDQRYVDPYKPSGIGGRIPSDFFQSADRNRYLEMLSIFNQLTPPKYHNFKEAGARSPSDPPTVHIQREVARELDLSVWMTRPCVIILARLQDSPCPIPIRVNGREVEPESGSLTILRWIYPLELDESEVLPPVSGRAEPALDALPPR